MSSYASRHRHPEFLLEQEYTEVKKTFREYDFKFVELGKHARYTCTIFLDELYPFRGQHWYTAGSVSSAFYYDLPKLRTAFTYLTGRADTSTFSSSLKNLFTL